MMRAAPFVIIFAGILTAGVVLWYALRAFEPAVPRVSTKDDLIAVEAPLPESEVRSPFVVAGKARGPWYFEGQFPVKMYDAAGVLLGSGSARANGAWMTQAYVPFHAAISFDTPLTATGTLVFEKDNPSGRPETADELVVPVRFAPASTTATAPSQTGMPIQLYFYNPLLDQGPAGAKCTQAGIVAVDRVIPQTDTPLAYALHMLLLGELSNEEKAQGIISAFPIEGVALASATVQNGIATIALTDPKHEMRKSACLANIVREEIEKTAKQFPEVSSVTLVPGQLFGP